MASFGTHFEPESDDLPVAILSDYGEALRDALRMDGVSPFKLAGLNLYDELARMEISLRRCREKGGHPQLSTFLELTALRHRYTEQYERINQQRDWIIELDRCFEPDDDQGQRRTVRQVKRAVTEFLEHLTQEARERPDEAKSSPRLSKRCAIAGGDSSPAIGFRMCLPPTMIWKRFSKS